MSFYSFSGYTNVSTNAKGSRRDTGSWLSCCIRSAPVAMPADHVRQDGLFIGVKDINTNSSNQG